MLGVTVVGSLCAQNSIASRVILLICDFFQTFPSFIYLIPVIMLFGITDTSVIIAAIVYARFRRCAIPSKVCVMCRPYCRMPVR